MSNKSPYRLTNNSTHYRKDASPLKATTINESNSKTDKGKSNKYKHQYTNKRYYDDVVDQTYNHKFTQKKRNQSIHQMDIENKIQKNHLLANENIELYQMLEQRGQIIVALERKLQEQIDRQSQTLEAIQIQKNMFIKESHKKFKDYEKVIEKYKDQVYHLRHQKQQLQIVLTRQLQHAKSQLYKMHQMFKNQQSVKQYQQLQQNKMKYLLDLKHNQISQLNLQYRNIIQKLKNQIILSNNQLVHIEHLKKIQLSQLKIQHESKLQKLHQFYAKEKDMMILQSDLLVKQREEIIENHERLIKQILQEKKMGEIERNIRQNDLLQTNEKLLIEKRNFQQFCKKVSKDEIERLKDLNHNDILALQFNKNEHTSNLLSQNNKLKQLMDIKSQQISRLHDEITKLRMNYSQDCKNNQRMIVQLKDKIVQIDQQKLQEQQRLKIKLSQLREADLTTLKTYYEHQIENLTSALQEKTAVANKNRDLLYEQLQEKEQLRKRFDLQVMQLNSKIRQLQYTIDELAITKGQAIKTTTQQREMTSVTLIRQTKDKQRLNENNGQERKRLQQLILAKDKQIEELSNKIKLIISNGDREMEQKNVEIELIRDGKMGIEMQLKKQKIFYDNELKKRDIVIKMNKQNYEVQMNRLKDNHRNQYDYMIKQLTGEKNVLEVQLNKSKNNQKMLRNQLQYLERKNKEDIHFKEQEIKHEKNRLSQDKTITVDKMSAYYNQEIQRLSTEISDLKRKLMLKEQDLRNLGDEYHKLQRKLEQVFESQQKLKKMQKMIIEMGQDNNLVKNVAQLIKYRQQK